MAKQRYINTKYWDDRYIRELSPNGKLVFLYLVSGPLATISGAYEITVDHINFHTGVSEIEIGAWLEKFEVDDKATYRDGWIVIHNTIKHQVTTNEKIRTGIAESVKCCPGWIKDILCIRHDWLSHLNLNLNLNSNLNARAPSGETPPPLTLVRKPDEEKKEQEQAEAVVKVWKTCGHWPPPEISAMIIEALGEKPDLDRLRLCYAIWRARGFKETNFDWVLDWYVNGIKKWRAKRDQKSAIRASMQVGAHDPLADHQEAVLCKECCDTGHLLVWPDESKILECERRPCPNGCQAPEGTQFGKLPIAKVS